MLALVRRDLMTLTISILLSVFVILKPKSFHPSLLAYFYSWPLITWLDNQYLGLAAETIRVENLFLPGVISLILAGSLTAKLYKEKNVKTDELLPFFLFLGFCSNGYFQLAIVGSSLILILKEFRARYSNGRHLESKVWFNLSTFLVLGFLWTTPIEINPIISQTIVILLLIKLLLSFELESILAGCSMLMAASFSGGVSAVAFWVYAGVVYAFLIIYLNSDLNKLVQVNIAKVGALVFVKDKLTVKGGDNPLVIKNYPVREDRVTIESTSRLSENIIWLQNYWLIILVVSMLAVFAWGVSNG